MTALWIPAPGSGAPDRQTTIDAIETTRRISHHTLGFDIPYFIEHSYRQRIDDYFNQNIRDTIDIENDYYRYFITEWGWNRDEEDINYLQPKYNFYFMPLSELDKNEKLKQTIYWGEADVFDPLAD